MITSNSTKEEIEATLADFLTSNPHSEISKGPGTFRIRKPWADETLVLDILDDAVIDALNQVHLPPRFTALWHRDTTDFEIIYTALSVDPELVTRGFEFLFRGEKMLCEFGTASDRLLTLARAYRPVDAPTSTQHRNLESFRYYLHIRSHGEEGVSPPETTPTSFWIRRFAWNEDRAIELARHLNFYMRYFDRHTPLIAVHQEVPTPEHTPRDRFPHGDFPEHMNGQVLDPYLLGLWEGSQFSMDPFRRFLYNYQILEYAAFYYLQDNIQHAVRKVISSPDILSRPSEAVTRILDALVDDRMSDDQKIAAVMKQCVAPEEVWSDIECYADFFSVDTVFDGGCVIPALLKPGWTLDDFASAWIPKLPDTFRRLRNALVHARELRMSSSIAPTAANYERLRPWLGPLSVAANQIILYRHQ